MPEPGSFLSEAAAYLYILWASRQEFKDTAGHYIMPLIAAHESDAEQVLAKAGYSDDSITDTKRSLGIWLLLRTMEQRDNILFLAGYPSVAPSLEDFRGK